jgi:hypothetical protein
MGRKKTMIEIVTMILCALLLAYAVLLLCTPAAGTDSEPMLEQPDMRAVKVPSGWFYRLIGKQAWMYELRSEYVYYFSYMGEQFRLRIPAKLRFDGASVPWIVKLLTGLERDGLHRPAWTLHDVIYKYAGHLPPGFLQILIGEEWQDYEAVWSRADGDRLFGRVLRECGETRGTRRLMYRGVRLGGWWPWFWAKRRMRKQKQQQTNTARS